MSVDRNGTPRRKCECDYILSTPSLTHKHTTTKSRYQVEIGSPAYFDPTLLEEPQEPVVEEMKPEAVVQEESVQQESQPPSAYLQQYPPQGQDPRLVSHIQPGMSVPVNGGMRMAGGVHPQPLYHGMNGAGPAVGGMTMDPAQQQHQLHQQQMQMRHMSGMGVQQYGASNMGAHMGGPGMHTQQGMQGYPQMQQPTHQQQIAIPPAASMPGNGMAGMGVSMNMGMSQGGMPQQYQQQYQQQPQQSVQPGMGMMPPQAQYTQQGGMHGMDTGTMQMHDGVGAGISMYGAQPQQPGGYGMGQPGQQQPGRQMPPAGYPPGSYGGMY